MSDTIVAGIPVVRQGFAISAPPDAATVKRLQQAARKLGLTVVAWEFDGSDGRPGGGGYSRIELVQPGDLATLAVLWEAEA